MSQGFLQSLWDVVKLTGNQTIAGIKTFSSFPITPSAAPTTNYQVANKKYVDDSAGAVFSSRARARKTDIQSVATANWTRVTFEIEDFDGLGEFDLSLERFVPGSAGYYQVNAAVEFLNDTADVHFMIGIRRGGQDYARVSGHSAITDYYSLALSDVVYCSGPLHYIDLFCYHECGHNIDLARTVYTFLSIHRIS